MRGGTFVSFRTLGVDQQATRSQRSGGLCVRPASRLRPRDRQSHAGTLALSQHVSAKTEELGGPAAGARSVLTGPFDEPSAVDDAAEILFVDRHAGQRLDHSLQFEKGEAFREQFEDEGTVADLPPDPPQGGGADSPVIHRHGATKGLAGRLGIGTPISVAFLDERRLVQELVSLEHPLAIPRSPAQPETHLNAIAAARPPLLVSWLCDPLAQARSYALLDRLLSSCKPIFPGQKAVQIAPCGRDRRSGRGLWPAFASQGQIGHRHHPSPAAAFPRLTVAVAEGVELFHVAELDPGLLDHPPPHGELERAVTREVEGAGGERGRIAPDSADLRCTSGDRDDGGIDSDFNERWIGSVHRSRVGESRLDSMLGLKFRQARERAIAMQNSIKVLCCALAVVVGGGRALATGERVARGEEAMRDELASAPSAAVLAAFEALDSDGDGRLVLGELPAESIALLDSGGESGGTVDPKEFAASIATEWHRPPLASGLLAEYYVWRMAQAAEEGGIDVALDIGTEGLERVGGDYRLYLHIGWLAVSSGHLELAKTCAEGARTLDPSAGDVWCLEAQILLVLGQVEAAIELLESKIHIPSYRLCARTTLARLYRGSGRLDDARSILDDALASSPSSPEDAFRANLELAYLNLDLGDAAAAGLHALRAVAHHRIEPRAWAALAEALRRYGSTDSIEGRGTERSEVEERARSVTEQIREEMGKVGRRGGYR